MLKFRLPMRLVALCLLAQTLHMGAASAKDFPNRPVTLVVPYAAGGSVDFVARLAAEQLKATLGKPVLVENKPGASGLLGAQFVAKAAPDGHTLLFHNASAVASALYAFKSLGYDPRKDLRPVGLLVRQPGLLVVHPSLPVNTVQELVAYGRANPGKLSYGGGLFGSPLSTPAIMFAMATGVDMTGVSYKGSAPAVNDLLGGHIKVLFDIVSTSLPHARSGKMRALAVTTAQRLKSAPDVPTLAESGLPGYDFASWVGVSAPAGTPQAVVQRLNAELVRLLQDPQALQRIEASGLEPARPMSAEDFGGLIQREIELYGRIAKAAKVEPE